MQPTPRCKLRDTKTNTCGTHRTWRTRGPHPEAHPEATYKSPGTHSTNVQCAPVHLPCAGVPSPAPSPAYLAASRTVAVVVAEVPAVVAVVAVVALVGSPAVAVAAALVAVEDTWVAAGTRRSGTCTNWTHTGGSRSSKAFPDPSSSARTRTAAHARTAAHIDTHAAAATPPSLSTKHVGRANQLKHGRQIRRQSQNRTCRPRRTRGTRKADRRQLQRQVKRPYHDAQHRNAHQLPLCILCHHECPCPCVGQVDTSVLR